jgi:N6-L-threonylcarbamoyladenine synthase
MIAKREHAKNIQPLFELVMKEAKNPKIDAIAVTVGPGLEPALWVGIVFAEELSKKLGVPVIPVNHMEGHLLSSLVQKKKTFTYNKNTLRFPVLSLLVSGGHTELVLVKEFGNYKVIGETLDDASGEAFDKVARMLGLPYPGGPEISKLAEELREKEKQANEGLRFPRPMIKSKNFDFSFSGLKTAVLYYIRDHGPLTKKMKSEIAKEFEDAVTDVLVLKTLRAIETYKIKSLMLGGGVSGNIHLKRVLKKQLKGLNKNISIHFPTQPLSTDNALMIAIAGYFQYKKKPCPWPVYGRGKKFSKPQSIKANGNLRL